MSAEVARRVAVVGGGGFRTPRLLYGLLRHADALGLETVALYDRDPARARIMARIGARLPQTGSRRVSIEVAESLAEAVSAAAHVLVTIRPGGEMGRVHDERASRDCGVLGQETVGPGGFFLALRTIAALSELLPAIRAVNPRAWVINFANPVGIVSEAVLAEGVDRFVGVCDTPHHLQQELAHFLALPPEDLRAETVGLNHLGWFLALFHGERDLLPVILERLPEVQARVRPLSFFRADEIRSVDALPTEYVYLYQHAGEVARRISRAASRGAQVAERSGAFFARASKLAAAHEDDALLPLYCETLAGRSNSYFQEETGTPVNRGLDPATILSTESYERVAIDTMLGLAGQGGGRPVILNVRHGGAAGSILPADAVMELSCRVDPAGPVPIGLTRPVREPIPSLVQTLKHYEWATVEAARIRTEDAAVEALALNPLVAGRDLARALVRRRQELPAGPLFAKTVS